MIECCSITFGCCLLKPFYRFTFRLFYPFTIEVRLSYHCLCLGITFFSNLHQALYSIGVRRIGFVHPSSKEKISIFTSFFSSFFSPKLSFVHIFSHTIASVIGFGKIKQSFSFFIIGILFNPSVVLFGRLSNATTIAITESEFLFGFLVTIFGSFSKPFSTFFFGFRHPFTIEMKVGKLVLCLSITCFSYFFKPKGSILKRALYPFTF